MEDEMVKKRNRRTKRAACHLRSECTARSNRRYFRKLLAKDWDHLVIKLDPATGEYKMKTV
jgi:hypothetical protein